MTWRNAARTPWVPSAGHIASTWPPVYGGRVRAKKTPSPLPRMTALHLVVDKPGYVLGRLGGDGDAAQGKPCRRMSRMLSSKALLP